jgi:predicted nucleic acid-binding protein
VAVARPIELLVVDCSVIVKWELPDEDHVAEAMELLYDWQAAAVLVHSTDQLPSEIGSTFLRAIRRGRQAEAQARVSMRNLLILPYELRPSQPLVARAFDIAHRHNQRIYDCFYVALAGREGVDFWTGDERLCNSLAAHFPFIRFIADYKPLR